MAQAAASASARATTPRSCGPTHWTLEGEWSRGPESVALRRAGGSIAFRFEARDAHTDEGGRGELREGRLYQLVRARTVRIVFDAPGAEAYSFTFG